MLRKIAALAALTLTLAGCATAQRFDAAGDVHDLLVAIRDDDREAFEAHVDRGALKRSLEARLVREAQADNADDGWRAAAALLAPSVADLAGEALIRPEVFRAAARYYGYTPDKPLPGRVAIGGRLKALPDGRVCATKARDGPCLLVFTNVDGVWKLSGFEGEISDLRGKPRKAR
ncbi:MAG: DUF2939 domain-containing protein [Caulobacter sp.]|nr:DUF2939 domain-containing protein [Caulobacter sp.]